MKISSKKMFEYGLTEELIDIVCIMIGILSV